MNFKLLRIFTIIMSFFFLTGFVPILSLVVPGVTAITSGNIYKAGAQFIINQKIEKETGKNTAPFGVNLIVHPTNPRVMPDLQICIKHKVPIFITSLGAVSDLVDSVHNYGGLVFHDIIKRRHAEKATEAGVDGLILVAAGAGGHGGTINPMALINEVKTFFNKKIHIIRVFKNDSIFLFTSMMMIKSYS